MATRLEAMQELARRGKLPADLQPYYDELVKRGLVEGAGQDKPPEGAKPGSREYADWARDQAMAGKELPQVSESPEPESRASNEAVDRAFDGMRGLNYGKPPEPEPMVDGNPYASSLPGPAGDFQNTLRANAGGQSQGITANFADEVFAGVTAPFKAVGSAMAGKGFDIGREFNEGLQQTQQADDQIRALRPSAFDSGKTTGAFLMAGKAGAAPAALAAPTQSAGKLALKSAAITGGYGAASGFGEGRTMEERLKGAATGLVTGVAVGGAVGLGVGKLLKSGSGAVPTTEQIKGQAKTAFKASEATGAVISQPSVAVYADELSNMLKAEGLITPSGKVAGYPGVAHALNLIDDFAQGNTTILQAKTIRKALGRAAGSIDPAERQIAVRMIEQFDDFMEALRPGNFVAGNGKEAVEQWTKGRAAYHVAKKSESVEKLIETAERKHRKNRATGIDASLRNQFDNFVGKDKNLRGFNPTERSALTGVAEGTRTGNAARAVGGLAPSSAAGLTVKGGVPFMVGNALGGPIAGAVASGATMGLGLAGRVVANLSSRQQAALASLIVRNGGKLPTAQMLPPVMQQALGPLLAIEGVQSPQLGAALLQMLDQGGAGQAPQKTVSLRNFLGSDTPAPYLGAPPPPPATVSPGN